MKDVQRNRLIQIYYIMAKPHGYTDIRTMFIIAANIVKILAAILIMPNTAAPISVSPRFLFEMPISQSKYVSDTKIIISWQGQ